MKKDRDYSELFYSSFTAFLGWSLIASQINHIDDADEPFGYWEPLHYLLYGDGLQTWEYAPQYAIRTYAFIFPFYILCLPLKMFMHLPKLTIFYALRAVLGTMSAYASSKMVQSIAEQIDFRIACLTMLMMLTAPGVFFASTAFLPSAVAGTLLMLATSAWLQSHYPFAITMGCIAVLATGWPFVGVLFAPMGLHMLYTVATTHATSNSNRTNSGPVFGWPLLGYASNSSGVVGLLQLILSGILLVTIITGAVAVIDHYYYGKWTLPTLNIFLYNAISSSSGDELYGVEPMMYYVKNLILTMGLAWPLTILAPAALLGDLVFNSNYNKTNASTLKIVIASIVCLWLILLFPRPHKEERFMYPIYPLLAFTGSITIDTTLRILARIFDNSDNDEGKSKTRKISTITTQLLLMLIILLSGSLFLMRIVSSVLNYQGYMMLWKDTNHFIQEDIISHQQKRQGEIYVCTGQEWYQFPSSFFLPTSASLQFIEDGFHGVLPQHFQYINGTSAQPLQSFNDMNREEKSRYVALDDCDYLIVLIDYNDPMYEVMAQEDVINVRSEDEGSDDRGNEDDDGMWEETENNAVSETEDNDHNGDIMHSALRLGLIAAVNGFDLITAQAVISPQYSSSAAGRAYYIPQLTARTVKFQQYGLYKNLAPSKPR